MLNNLSLDALDLSIRYFYLNIKLKIQFNIMLQCLESNAVKLPLLRDCCSHKTWPSQPNQSINTGYNILVYLILSYLAYGVVYLMFIVTDVFFFHAPNTIFRVSVSVRQHIVIGRIFLLALSYSINH